MASSNQAMAIKLAASTMSAAFMIMFLLLSSNLIEAQIPPTAAGLSYTFYRDSCPQLESIVQQHLRSVFSSDIRQAAGLLRLHFHDCVVQGCDGSVLLDGLAGEPSEKDTPPNESMKAQTFIIIEDLRRLVHNACGRVVSCSDISALAARDAVFMSGGPNYRIPLGRRDGLSFATRNVTLANFPPPMSNTTELLNSLGQKGFTPTDVVSLSGGHTIGTSHCLGFRERIHPNRDPTMDETLFNNLIRLCPTTNSSNITFMDIRSPYVFDNKYYVNLMNRQGLLNSDQELYTDSRTRSIVTSFAINQTLFYQNFVIAMIKVGQLNVLTGLQGEIRSNCSQRNSNNLFIVPNAKIEQDGKVASC